MKTTVAEESSPGGERGVGFGEGRRRRREREPEKE